MVINFSEYKKNPKLVKIEFFAVPEISDYPNVRSRPLFNFLNFQFDISIRVNLNFYEKQCRQGRNQINII